MKITEFVTENWQKTNRKDKTSGMSRKAVKQYRRENPGSKLQTAVTTKPSKLKKGSKSAKRRKSFCARMRGMKKSRTSAKTARNPNSNINKALRRWNCESIEQMQELVMIAEQKIAALRQGMTEGFDELDAYIKDKQAVKPSGGAGIKRGSYGTGERKTGYSGKTVGLTPYGTGSAIPSNRDFGKPHSIPRAAPRGIDDFDANHRKVDELGVAVEATGDPKFDAMMGRIATEPKVPDIHPDMPPTSIPELLQWAKENNKPYHYKFADWARKHNFTNVNAALMWFGDNVDPWDEFGPKDHLNVFGDLVGEPLIDAAKHNPKAAELLKVFACYEKIYNDWTDEYRQMKEQGVAEGTRQQLDFDSLYGKVFKITDNNGNPNNPGFSIVTPLNGESWNWRERPEFKKIVKQKLNDPAFLGDHKYQQIIDAMAGNKFDTTKHTVKQGVAEGFEKFQVGDKISFPLSQMATGIVDKIDDKRLYVKLDNGEVYTIPSTMLHSVKLLERQGVAENTTPDDEKVIELFAQIVADDTGYSVKKVNYEIYDEGLRTPSGIPVYFYSFDGDVRYIGALPGGKPTAIVNQDGEVGSRGSHLELSIGGQVEYVIKGKTLFSAADQQQIAKAKPGGDEYSLVLIALDLMWGRMQHKFMEQGAAEDQEDIVAVIDGVRSDRTYNDRYHAHNSLSKLVGYGKAKVAELYINGEKVEHFELGKKYIDFEPKSLGSMSEAGPFSYGAKKPRKGSIADLAAKKHKEQEKGKLPAEPRDHMVGVARIIK